MKAKVKLMIVNEQRNEAILKKIDKIRKQKSKNIDNLLISVSHSEKKRKNIS